jgi:hypothetical protein
MAMKLLLFLKPGKKTMTGKKKMKLLNLTEIKWRLRMPNELKVS